MNIDLKNEFKIIEGSRKMTKREEIHTYKLLYTAILKLLVELDDNELNNDNKEFAIRTTEFGDIEFTEKQLQIILSNLSKQVTKLIDETT